MKQLTALILLALAMSACHQASSNPTVVGATSAEQQTASVAAVAETRPTARDGANHPAIWIDADELGNSLVLGASNESGIEVYTLDGERVAVQDGRPINLVDVQYNFPLDGQSVSLAVAFDPSSAELVAYVLNPENSSLTEVSTGGLETETEIEGLCLYHSPLSGKFYVFVAGTGVLQQWELFDRAGSVSGRKIRTVPVGLGASYCAVQDSNSSLFLAQETVGLWRINAEPESEAIPEPVDFVAPFGTFEGDIKGVALIEFANGGGYLFASDADLNRIQVYDLKGLGHVATIHTQAGNGVDEVNEPEGIAVTGLALSDAFPEGLMVLSDEDNEGENTNFKLFSWRDVVQAYGLEAGSPLDPRVPVVSDTLTVSASVETAPVKGYGDAADDPAIWIHPTQPELSLVIGTQKKMGLNVYDLSGSLLQSLPDGRLNNADLRYGFSLGGKSVDILAGSNRSTDSISIYLIDADTRTLQNVAAREIPTGMMDPYGLCMYRSPRSGDYFVFVNDTDGVMKQWRLVDNGSGRVDAVLVREFSFDSQTEGCVADDDFGILYVGEEDVGIWKLSAEPDEGTERSLVDSVAEGNLTDDVEGLSLYYAADGNGYLVASNQGADNYALYERGGDNRFLGLFHVVADKATGIDGASETDGLDVTSANLGPDFPHGLFVVQDGRNITPDGRQNFKLVPWERIADAFGLPLSSGYDPRAGKP